MTHTTLQAPAAVSQLTLAALRDAGWNVNFGTAQPYALPVGGVSSSLAGATAIATLSAGNTFSGNYSTAVNSEYPDQLYRFDLNSLGALSLTLSGLTANANMRLIYDANNNGAIDANEIIATSSNPRTSNESINLANLAAGTYYVDIYATNTADAYGNRLVNATNFTLNYSASASYTPLTTGGSLTNALNNTDNGTFLTANPGYTYTGGSRSWAVSDSNIDDLYLFNFLGNVQQFDVKLSGLSDTASMRLIYDANNNGLLEAGEILTTTSYSGTTDQLISRSNLAAGKYYIQVCRGGTSSTNAVGPLPSTSYTLSMIQTDMA